MTDNSSKKIVPKNSYEEIRKIGEKTYQENKVMSLIADVMSDCKFRNLFDEYFNDWNDIKTILMIMKVYQNIEISKTNENLDKVEIIGAVQNIIKNSETRLSVVNAMDNFMKTDIKKQNIKKKPVKYDQ